MNEEKGYEVDRAVDWVAFGAAWYYLVWPEYLAIAWGPAALAFLWSGAHPYFHEAIGWGIGTTAVFLLSVIYRRLGMVIAFLFGCAWGAGGGFVAFWLTTDWYWGVAGGLIVMYVSWSIHHAALAMPSGRGT